MTDKFASILHDLLSELSTELDLHYNEPDYVGLENTFEPMQQAAVALKGLGRPLPESYLHVLKLFQRTHNCEETRNV